MERDAMAACHIVSFPGLTNFSECRKALQSLILRQFWGARISIGRSGIARGASAGFSMLLLWLPERKGPNLKLVVGGIASAPWRPSQARLVQFLPKGFDEQGHRIPNGKVAALRQLTGQRKRIVN